MLLESTSRFVADALFFDLDRNPIQCSQPLHNSRGGHEGVSVADTLHRPGSEDAGGLGSQCLFAQGSALEVCSVADAHAVSHLCRHRVGTRLAFCHARVGCQAAQIVPPQDSPSLRTQMSASPKGNRYCEKRSDANAPLNAENHQTIQTKQTPPRVLFSHSGIHSQRMRPATANPLISQSANLVGSVT